jgi:hypothetical protein
MIFESFTVDFAVDSSIEFLDAIRRWQQKSSGVQASHQDGGISSGWRNTW